MITVAIDGLTRRLADYRVMRNWSREMSRLDEKWAKAGGVVQRAEQHIEGKLDELIAREQEVKDKTTEVFMRQNSPLNDQLKALDALDRKLDLLSNGAPDGPLPGSADSQDSQQQQSPPEVGFDPTAVPFRPVQPGH